MGLRTIERLKTRRMVLPAGFVQPDRLEYDQVVLDATEFAQLFRRSDALDEVLLSVRTCITPGTHDCLASDAANATTLTALIAAKFGINSAVAYSFVKMPHDRANSLLPATNSTDKLHIHHRPV